MNNETNLIAGFSAVTAVSLVEEEPEYPDPCPKLRELISQAVADGDEEWILNMMRQVVRQTKENIIKRIQDTV
jgi:hypothetical protein